MNLKRKRENNDDHASTTVAQCAANRCSFFANLPAKWCSSHMNCEGKEIHLTPQLLPLTLLIHQVTPFDAKGASCLLRFLLETEEGREAKYVLDGTYETVFDGYSREKRDCILPLNLKLQTFINYFLEMIGLQLIGLNEFASFTKEFRQATVPWYPHGFPLNLWAHFLAHSNLIVMAASVNHDSFRELKIHDKTGDCALVHFEEARKQYAQFDDLPKTLIKQIENNMNSVLDMATHWHPDILRCVLEYSVKEDVMMFVHNT